jgi:CPA1 family monovalent cation:H+ antiporter
VRNVETVVVLVALATVVAAFAQRLWVPAPSLLVAVGLAVGLLPGGPLIHVPPAVVSLVVLPPLLYAASEELSWRDLRPCGGQSWCWPWAWCWPRRPRSPP